MQNAERRLSFVYFFAQVFLIHSRALLGILIMILLFPCGDNVNGEEGVRRLNVSRTHFHTVSDLILQIKVVVL